MRAPTASVKVMLSPERVAAEDEPDGEDDPAEEAGAAGVVDGGCDGLILVDDLAALFQAVGGLGKQTVAHDKPISLGVEHFCETCRKCAESCPSHALTLGPKVEVNGTRRYPTNVERCHAWWRQGGTDCGVCMASCPFSHEDSGFHNLVRATIRRAPWTRRPFVFFDDVFYGRRWKPSAEAPPAPTDVP